MAIPFFLFYPSERTPMNKEPIITNQMKYDYSAKVVFSLYMDQLITEQEYRIILVRLKAHYGITESNG
jgi:hypothetical protein